MAKAFPSDNPFLHGYYGPVNTEADAGHLHITGELPKELLGTLYRNGPNPQFPPRAGPRAEHRRQVGEQHPVDRLAADVTGKGMATCDLLVIAG